MFFRMLNGRRFFSKSRINLNSETPQPNGADGGALDIGPGRSAHLGEGDGMVVVHTHARELDEYFVVEGRDHYWTVISQLTSGCASEAWVG